jgi:hypothetical protein
MKPQILCCILCGPERTDWINPSLCYALLKLQRDSRFDLTVEMTYNKRPVEHARNQCVVNARARGVDYLVQIDNDMVLPFDFGSILHEAILTGKAVVALAYGALLPEGPQIIPGDNGPRDGEFKETGCAGGGVLIISSEVWRVIPRGPWFQWLTNSDECLSRKLSEDYYFCELVREHGLKVWTHQRHAGHLKSSDATWLIGQIAQKGR